MASGNSYLRYNLKNNTFYTAILRKYSKKITMIKIFVFHECLYSNFVSKKLVYS
ncbi:hypothetical protein OTBS_1712 [Orientia tsutsugamushi str. Boryong]|uniref:Uncharacterized protein n=1 Tax=Orientia tsutsugamushi (strain Boryong) TaxID=357244 RepID=A5CEX6_ORITB|nr:hypothetical protein OTBS_1712 [Orientia tsutsugamushi str. Boryong]